MKYRIYPVYLGSKPFNLGGAPTRMALGAFALKDENGEIILADTGAPSISEMREKHYPLHELVAESIEYVDALREVGVAPKKVKTVLLSHLHWDHAWNLKHLPNAEFIVQEDELACAKNPDEKELLSYGHTVETNGPDFARVLDQIKTVSGDFEFRPGINIIRTPGHSCGSVTILVDTKNGTYGLIGDFVVLNANLANCVPPMTATDKDAWCASYDKLMATGATLLPSHELEVYSKKIYG